MIGRHVVAVAAYSLLCAACTTAPTPSGGPSTITLDGRDYALRLDSPLQVPHDALAIVGELPGGSSDETLYRIDGIDPSRALLLAKPEGGYALLLHPPRSGTPRVATVPELCAYLLAADRRAEGCP